MTIAEILDRVPRAAAAALAVTLVTACASAPEDPDELAAYEEANDPLEDVNREIFDVNMWLDRNIMRPVAEGYRDTVPQMARDSAGNFIANVSFPVTFVNDVLQGETGRAAETLMRFVVNTTAGMGGFFDAAAEMGLPRHTEDFGQTLAVWGVEEGPYLMLPLLGPSTVRDFFGWLVDRGFNPLYYVGLYEDPHALELYDYASTPVDTLNDRVENLGVVEELERTSIDFYAAVRSLYRQRRNDAIRNSAEEEDDTGSPSLITEYRE